MEDAMPSVERTPFALVGGAGRVRAIVETFYDVMDAREPALARLHSLDESGKVSRPTRDRFALFLIGWLGGPQEYTEKHGHPRLRMRHAHVAIDGAMRDAWLRSMTRALDDHTVSGPVREFLDSRFADVAAFLQNRPE